MQEIRWGIIGCGDVTEVKSGPAFNKVANSKLVAVMRRDANKAKDYAERHQVPKWYNNADDLINDPGINAIYIATPPLQHEEYTAAALKAGKPVYVEKPMAMDAGGAERMQKLSEQTGVMLAVAHYRREQPFFRKIKELIENGAIGEIRFANLQLLQPFHSKMITRTPDNWRVNPAVSGGGLFHDLAPHQLDLMIHFFGKVIKSGGMSLNQARYYNADDIVIGSLLFENKVLFNGLWAFNVPAAEARDHCEIVGAEGKITFAVFNQDKVVLSVKGQKEEFSFDKLAHLQQPMIEKVVQYFLGKAENPCPAADGVQVMSLIDSFTGK